jgi:hypothetical protein
VSETVVVLHIRWPEVGLSEVPEDEVRIAAVGTALSCSFYVSLAWPNAWKRPFKT